MNRIERMERVKAGRAPDRTPFVPSIYEHGATVLGRSPGEVSRDAGLMAEAALESYRAYGHDLVTVGIDIYNIEAEAWGCPVSGGEGSSIPGIVSHPLADAGVLEPERLVAPAPGAGNRLGLFVDAVGRVVRAIGNEVWVYGCLGGPFSQAVELRGFDRIVADMFEAPERVHALMERTTALSLAHAERVSETGAGVYLYESWATMPLITADIFRDYVTPYNKAVVQAVKTKYDTPPPSVIMGGDITVLGEFFLEMGVSLVAADYLSDFGVLRGYFDGTGTIVRGCVDPKLIERGDWEALARMVDALAEKAQGMNNFVWGCGCVSYHTPQDNLLRFKELCAAAR
ncbi:MAG: hypothetical protein JXR94_03270 [Candidatus Hydrogenedentes bacterium]|nr:hypothetical protein [Candidatus Hydrogenedentota bacterium]